VCGFLGLAPNTLYFSALCKLHTMSWVSRDADGASWSAATGVVACGKRQGRTLTAAVGVATTDSVRAVREQGTELQIRNLISFLYCLHVCVIFPSPIAVPRRTENYSQCWDLTCMNSGLCFSSCEFILSECTSYLLVRGKPK